MARGATLTPRSRTRVDVTTAGLAEEQVRQAICEALRCGLSSREGVFRRAAAHGSRSKRSLEENLRVEEQ